MAKKGKKTHGKCTQKTRVFSPSAGKTVTRCKRFAKKK